MIKGAEDEAVDSYSHIESKAYEMLFDHIRFDLLENPRVAQLMELKVVLLLVSCRSDSTKKHLTRKLEQKFSSVLHFED